MRKKLLTYLKYLIIAGVVVFGLIQLVPIDRVNPPTTQEPTWSSPEARTLTKKNCFQCHSNETEWPWYSYIAPASWLIKSDVVRAREAFNFSEWDTNRGTADDMNFQIETGRMPPIQYTLFHPDAVLNEAQKKELMDALSSSFK